MACDLAADSCRAQHIAGHLSNPEEDSGDYEAKCPDCGHRGFRISHARVRAYRNVWTCACKVCKCTPTSLRVALLKLNIPVACIGIYEGPIRKDVDPEAARAMDRTINDIFTVQHLRPADMRLMLAEAQGRKLPEEFRPFVKFAVSIGISPTQAKDAAARWCRPPDWSPPAGGGGS